MQLDYLERKSIKKIDKYTIVEGLSIGCRKTEPA